MTRLSHYLLIVISLVTATSASSCEKHDPEHVGGLKISHLADTITAIVNPAHPYNEWTERDNISIKQYAPLNFSHQSAASYGDYAFFIANGRSKICLYNLAKQEIVSSLNMPAKNGNLYHCNQSTFSTEFYDPEDPFPLLYISQRNNSSGRCFIEGFRIKPKKGEDSDEFEELSLELVQTIYLPAMSYENSLGNANCVIDADNKVMYTYSRNNVEADDNYLICKITKFEIPPVHQAVITLEESDILDSFMLDCTAFNMQGGCIKDGILYIGQGTPDQGDLFFNVVDLGKRSLVKRLALDNYNAKWEPEGCFFYDGSVMLAHTSYISRIDKK